MNAPVEGASRRRSLDVAAVVAAPVLSIVISVLFIARSAFTVAGKTYFVLFDDAMVAMRFAKNLADGHGLTWNAGQHPVEGYSDFLWTLIMAAVHLLPISDRFTSLAVMVVSAAVLVWASYLAGLLTLELGGDSTSRLVAGVLVASYAPLVYWSLRGLEVGAVSAVVLFGALSAARLVRTSAGRHAVSLAVAASAGVLIRDDVIVPMVVIFGFVAWNLPGRRRLVGCGVPIAALLVTEIGHLVFRLVYYGEPLPNTYYLKVSGVSSISRISRGSGWLAVEISAELLLVVILGVWWWARTRNRFALLLLALFAGESAYMVYVGGDVWEAFGFPDRFLTPGVVALLPLSAIAIVAAFRSERATAYRLALLVFGAAIVAAANVPGAVPIGRISSHAEVGPPFVWEWWVSPVVIAFSLLLVGVPLRPRVMRTLGLATTVGALALSLSGWVFWQFAVQHQVVSPGDRAAVPLALATKAATAPDATVAVVAGGTTPYFDDRPSIDLLGKSDAVVARTKPHGPFIPGHNKWDYNYSIGELRPDVVLAMWQHTGRDVDNLTRWGYKPITRCYNGDVDYWAIAYYRPSVRVRIAPLRRLLRASLTC